jgi:ABC-type ATPase involved in cell division
VTKLTISRVGKTYADGTEALRDIQVTADSGEIVAILGSSGTRSRARRSTGWCWIRVGSCDRRS